MTDQKTGLYVRGDVISTLKNCGGYYCKPTTALERPAPLVAYVGTYETNVPGRPLREHYVGFEYFNLARAEQFPHIRKCWALEWQEHLKRRMDEHSLKIEVFFGAPMGGILYADSLAELCSARVVFAEKHRSNDLNLGRKTVSEFTFNRHQISEGDVVCIVEDACHNFSTTGKMIEIVEEEGGIVEFIACIVNRSGRLFYHLRGRAIPVISVLEVTTMEFRQDDPKVCDDIRLGHVCWDPKKKKNWATLMGIMDKQSTGK